MYYVCHNSKFLQITKLVYFELQDIMCNGAKCRQTVAYGLFAFSWQGNDMVIELCLIFV